MAEARSHKDVRPPSFDAGKRQARLTLRVISKLRHLKTPLRPCEVPFSLGERELVSVRFSFGQAKEK